MNAKMIFYTWIDILVIIIIIIYILIQMLEKIDEKEKYNCQDRDQDQISYDGVDNMCWCFCEWSFREKVENGRWRMTQNSS